MAVSSIEEVVADIKAGKMIILVDDEDRENEGDLCMAGECVTARSDQLHGYPMEEGLSVWP